MSFLPITGFNQYLLFNLMFFVCICIDCYISIVFICNTLVVTLPVFACKSHMLIVWFWVINEVIKEFKLHLYSWIECLWTAMLSYNKTTNSFPKLNVLLRVCWLYCAFIIGIMDFILNLIKRKIIQYHEHCL